MADLGILARHIQAGDKVIEIYGVGPDGTCHCGKGKNCGSAGKHPRARGWQDSPGLALADVEAVVVTRPRANFGLLTGYAFWVLDIDPDNGGDVALKQLISDHGHLPKTRVTQTGSGGWHYHFRCPPDLEVTNSAGRLPPGIDVRGKGGQVVAPGSQSGKGAYAERIDAPVDYAPQWLLDLLRPTTTAEPAQPAAVVRQASPREAAYEKSVIKGELAKVSDLERLGKLAPWDTTTFAVGCKIVELVNAPWCDLTETEGHRLFIEACPPPEPGYDPEVKWGSALAKVGDKARPAPPEPELDFMHRAETDPSVRKALAMPVLLTSAVDPSMFIDRKDGLLAETLTQHVRAMGPIARDPGRALWAYGDGVWTHDDDDARRRVQALLGDRYRMSYADTVIDKIRSQKAFITDAPQTRYVNFRNGLLDLTTRQLVPHSPSVMSTNQLAVDWNPEACCPRIDAWLEEVQPETPARQLWLEMLGYGLYGDNPLHKAALWEGKGRNGKGTSMRLLTAVLGGGNVSAQAPQKLDSDQWSTAQLFGKMVNLAGDVSPRTFVETENFKRATGGDLLSAQRKYGQPFNFVCRAFMIASFNELPTSADGTDGFFSRWVVLPFTVKFADPIEGVQPAGTLPLDAGIESRLLAPEELEGLAVKMVNALLGVLERGRFTDTKGSRDAAERFRRHADPVRGFLAEAVESADDYWVSKAELYGAYVRWCREGGSVPLSARRFNPHLEAVHANIFGHEAEEGKRGLSGWRTLMLRPEHRAVTC